MTIAIAFGLLHLPVGLALARPASDASYSCVCQRDRDGSAELCYGYVLTIGPKRLELYEGETGGSGRYSKRHTQSGDVYTATIRTQTGQKLKVIAERKLNGETKVYTGRMKPGAYDFIALCR